MGPHQTYDKFAAEYGAGYDPAGRVTFGGVGYYSPSEGAKMKAHMHKLGADVSRANAGSAAAAANAMQQRAMKQQDEDRAFQKNMMTQNANRAYDLQNKKIGLLQGLTRNL